MWAVTNDALNVTRFYKDSTLSIIWEPPVADKFYLFYNTDRNYTTGVTIPGTGDPTNKPLFCAKFDANGQIIPQTSPDNTVQTAWSPVAGAVSNYGRNITQFSSI